MALKRVALPGTARQPLSNSQIIGIPDPHSLITVSVILRRRPGKEPTIEDKPVSREEFSEKYGADQADVEVIERFAADNDMTVGEVNLGRRTMVLAGTVANLAEAFGTELRLFQSPDGVFRGRVGILTVPEEIAAIVTG